MSSFDKKAFAVGIAVALVTAIVPHLSQATLAIANVA